MIPDEELAREPYAALLYDEEEDYEDVIAFLTDVIASDPDNYVAYNNRGLAFEEIGRQLACPAQPN